MSEPFVVAFVPGATPGKWERIWRERLPRSPLELRPLPQDAALVALRDGSAHMALVRDVTEQRRAEAALRRPRGGAGIWEMRSGQSARERMSQKGGMNSGTDGRKCMNAQIDIV